MLTAGLTVLRPGGAQAPGPRDGHSVPHSFQLPNNPGANWAGPQKSQERVGRGEPQPPGPATLLRPSPQLLV